MCFRKKPLKVKTRNGILKNNYHILFIYIFKQIISSELRKNLYENIQNERPMKKITNYSFLRVS